MAAELITAAEAAERWGISPRQVQRLLSAGRITGAEKYGAVWMIPADSLRPSDLRRRETERSEKLPFYTMVRECPTLILTSFYRKPGSGDHMADSLAGDAQAQRLFRAELAYFRGEIDAAKELAEPLLKISERRDVRLGAGLVLCLCAMYMGDVAGWSHARRAISDVHCDTPGQATQRELQLVAVDSGIYDKRGCPDWLRKGCFDLLPGDSYPLARQMFLKVLLLEKGDPRMSAVCGPMISQCKLDGALLSEIYSRLLVAIGFHDIGDNDRAAEQIDAAIALALPDRLYSPLCEHRRDLGVLFDERLAAADKTALREVRRLNKRLMNGWTVLYRRINQKDFSSELTLREHHAAKLAAKGLSNADIAQLMGVSVNTVKRYIAEALGKTGAASRMELSKYIAMDDVV